MGQRREPVAEPLQHGTARLERLEAAVRADYALARAERVALADGQHALTREIRRARSKLNETLDRGD